MNFIDPTYDRVRSVLSFNPQPQTINNFLGFSNRNSIIPNKINFEHKQLGSYGPGQSFADQKLFNALQNVKRQFNVDPNEFEKSKKVINPFEKLGNSIFIARPALSLAGIDNVLNISPDTFTYENQSNDRQLKFIDLAAAPGSWSQYIRYRYPNSNGIAITISDNKKQFKLDDVLNIGKGKFELITQDLYLYWKEFLDKITKEKFDADLIVGDAGFDMTPDMVEQQEFIISRLLTIQILIGLYGNIGSNAVFKVFDTVTKYTGQLIYLLSLCYENVNIFKPITSRPANAEAFLICKGLTPNCVVVRKIVRDCVEKFTENKYLTSIFDDITPEYERFTKWLIERNSQLINIQIMAATKIITYMQTQEIETDDIDVLKVYILWNLPGNKPKLQNQYKTSRNISQGRSPRNASQDRTSRTTSISPRIASQDRTYGDRSSRNIPQYRVKNSKDTSQSLTK